MQRRSRCRSCVSAPCQCRLSRCGKNERKKAKACEERQRSQASHLVQSAAPLGRRGRPSKHAWQHGRVSQQQVHGHDHVPKLRVRHSLQHRDVGGGLRGVTRAAAREGAGGRGRGEYTKGGRPLQRLGQFLSTTAAATPLQQPQITTATTIATATTTTITTPRHSPRITQQHHYHHHCHRHSPRVAQHHRHGVLPNRPPLPLPLTHITLRHQPRGLPQPDAALLLADGRRCLRAPHPVTRVLAPPLAVVGEGATAAAIGDVGLQCLGRVGDGE